MSGPFHTTPVGTGVPMDASTKSSSVACRTKSSSRASRRARSRLMLLYLPVLASYCSAHLPAGAAHRGSHTA